MAETDGAQLTQQQREAPYQDDWSLTFLLLKAQLPAQDLLPNCKASLV